MKETGKSAPVQPESGYRTGFDVVHRDELEAISKHWKSFDEDDLNGLALSGGGIRSAAFSLGALQQLHNAGVVQQLHYLSTVSGGGYAGACLTWFLSRKGENGKSCFGVADNFPFTGGEAAGLRRSGGDEGVSPDSDLAGRPIVDFIRQRSSYLLPGLGIDLVSGFAIVLRSVVISLFGYLLLFSLFGLLILWLGIPAWGFAGYPVSFIASAALVALLLASMVLYAMIAPAPWLDHVSYGFRHYYQRWAGSVLRGAMGFAVFGFWLLIATPEAAQSFPGLGEQVKRFIEALRDAVMEGETAAAAGGIGALGGMLTRALVKSEGGFFSRLALKLVPPVALLLLIFALGIGGLLIATEVKASAHASWWVIVLVGFFVFYSLYANLNLTGLHRFYRDRLMETFMPNLDDVRADRRSTRTSADTTALSEMFSDQHQGPYHLINTNLVLLDGALARYRSRGGDSFVLSPLYCGSESTGFIRTENWTPGFSWVIRAVGPLTLPTAMAISAAAVNPRSGPDGKGITRRASVSTLLTILNLRLGCWLPSPQVERFWPWLARFYPPNFFVPGLSQGLLGFGRDENAAWIELTDGGHFDNTGIYELARRRVKTIYFVDGTEDPETSFASFANAIEKIYIDFNVKVAFGERESFTELMIDAANAASPLAKKFRLAKNGFAVATLTYPRIPGRDGRPAKPKLEGHLYYIKATMTPDLPAALYSYKADNVAFPSEPTTDQFFTEQQFEAYRALGSALAKGLAAHLSGGSD